MFAYIKDSKIDHTSPISEVIEDGFIEIQYPESIQFPFLEKGKIVNRIPDIVKHKMKYDEILSVETLEGFSLDGEVFTDEEIGDIITYRVFGNNPHAERATTNKVLKILANLVLTFSATGSMPALTEEQAEKVSSALARGSQVDEIRNLFKIGNL